MSDFAQTVKQQADIVKVIESYIRLRKAGAQRFTGLCPFHKEKTPSFSVHAGQQFFYCFGCQASGDVFSFVGKIENVGFPEAVRIVAQKCGIPLPKREPLALAVHRHDNMVYFKRLEPEAFAIVKALREGATVTAACEKALRRADPSVDCRPAQ